MALFLIQEVHTKFLPFMAFTSTFHYKYNEMHFVPEQI